MTLTPFAQARAAARTLPVWVVLAAVVGPARGGLAAQTTETPPLVPGQFVSVTPEGDYRTHVVHEFFLGKNHREEWSTPITVEVLDLAAFAGGLTPVRRGGGLQTRSLRLRGADGVLYNFRSLDKDASRTLDPELRRSVAARVLQDQISALLPVSALVVAPLLEAAGVLHADPVLRVMPDDPRLGEFREEFAGMLGLLEERPDEGPDGTPGFAGSERVTGSDRMLERLEESPEDRVDGRAFLRARLLDIFVGDWDRHPDQWRWAEFDEGDGRSRWEPIPRDRDWALARLEGVLVWAAGFLWPHYHGFDHDYPSAFQATWSGRALDRRILPTLSWDDWRVVVEDVQARLGDPVLEEAVSRLPPGYAALMGEELLRALRNRRDVLPDMAREFYELLAAEPDLWATDEDEDVEVDRRPDGSVDVRYAVEGRAYLARTFSPQETNEIRLHLRGGDDRVTVQGQAPSSIQVRVIGGGGDDTVEDDTDGRALAIYDHRGDNRISVGPAAHVDEYDYEEPDDPGSATHQARARDWGSYAVPVPYLSVDSDLGLFVGAGFVRWGYGFRHFPWETRVAASVGIGTASGKLRAALDLDVPLLGPDVRIRAGASWSGAEVNRFYGRGNGTSAEGDADRFKAEREEVRADALVTILPSDGVWFGFGPSLRFYDLFGNPGRLVTELQPYGAEEAFGILGLAGEVGMERRDVVGAAEHGGYARVRGHLYPAVWDARSTFGAVRVEGAAYTTLDAALEPNFAVRAGAARVFGDAPYQELAYLGGQGSLRGFPNDRFAGQGALFASAEVRLTLGELFFLLPGDFGVLGLVDVGRVFDDEDTVGDVHSSVGGGVWTSFVNRSGTVSLTLANGSDGDLRVYLKAGMPF